MRFTVIVLAFLAIFMAPNFFRSEWQTPAQAETMEERPRLVAAMFRSSWCGACRILEPRVDDVREDYQDAAVEFIRFDFTLGRRAGLRERAEEAGISEVFLELEGRTGFMLLIDRDTGQVFEAVTTDHNRDNIRAALDRWLAVTAASAAALPDGD